MPVETLPFPVPPRGDRAAAQPPAPCRPPPVALAPAQGLQRALATALSALAAVALLAGLLAAPAAQAERQRPGQTRGQTATARQTPPPAAREGRAQARNPSRSQVRKTSPRQATRALTKATSQARSRTRRAPAASAQPRATPVDTRSTAARRAASAARLTPPLPAFATAADQGWGTAAALPDASAAAGDPAPDGAAGEPCDLRWQLRLQADGRSAVLSLNLRWPTDTSAARGQPRPAQQLLLQLPATWPQLNPVALDGTPALLPVADAPLLRTLAYAGQPQLQLRWQLRPAPGLQALQLRPHWLLMAGHAVLPVPEVAPVGRALALCVGIEGLPDDSRWMGSSGVGQGGRMLWRSLGSPGQVQHMLWAGGRLHWLTRQADGQTLHLAQPDDGRQPAAALLPLAAAFAEAVQQQRRHWHDADAPQTALLVLPPAATAADTATPAGGNATAPAAATAASALNDSADRLQGPGPAADDASPDRRSAAASAHSGAENGLAGSPGSDPDSSPDRAPDEGPATGQAWGQLLLLPQPTAPARAAATRLALHEALLRQRLPDRLGPQVVLGRHDDALRAWLGEGLVAYALHRLPLQWGLWTLDDYAALINRRIADHLASPVLGASNAQVARGWMHDPALAALPSARGEWLALHWQQALRAAGHPGLDALLRTLMLPSAQARREGTLSQPLATHRLLAALRRVLGQRAHQDIERWIEQGQRFDFRADLLGPCFERGSAPAATPPTYRARPAAAAQADCRAWQGLSPAPTLPSPSPSP